MKKILALFLVLATVLSLMTVGAYAAADNALSVSCKLYDGYTVVTVQKSGTVYYTTDGTKPTDKSQEASLLIDGYFITFPKVHEYMEKAKQTAREHGYVETFFRRRRYLPDINSHNGTVRGFAERNAINAPIQGSAADIIKVAMVRIYKRFKDENLRSKMILQVHDELNFSVVPDEKETVERIVLEEMQGAYKLNVPLVADCGWGSNWLEAH